MTELTGLDKPAIAFDYDGVLTNAGVTVIGQDNDGVTLDVSPLSLFLDLGCSVGVMTCNDPEYVAGKLRDQGIDALADIAMTVRIWNGGIGGRQVLVTGRKLVADMYVDDHGCHWSYGQDKGILVSQLATTVFEKGELDTLETTMEQGADDSGECALALVDVLNLERGIVITDRTRNDYNGYLMGV